MSGAGRGRGLEWSLGIALVIAILVAAWQAMGASDARDQVAALENRVTALEADVEELRADNETLQAENDDLRASAEGGGSVSGLLGPLLRGEAPSEEDVLEFLIPFLEEELGSELGGLGELLGQGLGGFADELERGLGELFGSG